METVLRVTAVYLFIMLGVRALGKRDVGQLSPFDLATLLVIPEICSQALVGEDFSVTNALIGMSSLFVLVFLTSVITHKSKRLEDIIEGTPTVVVSRGRFVEENMNRERLSPDEVYAEMHRAGFENVGQIKWAVLEADGKIGFIPFSRQGGQSGGLDDGLA